MGNNVAKNLDKQISDSDDAKDKSKKERKFYGSSSSSTNPIVSMNIINKLYGSLSENLKSHKESLLPSNSNVGFFENDDLPLSCLNIQVN